MLVLSDLDVRRLLPMARAIDLMRTAFTMLVSGLAKVPIRTVLQDEQHGSTALFMPVSAVDTGFGLKMVTVQPSNAARGVPTITGAVMLFDSASGRPEALLAAESLTAIRTGAASGLATDILARHEASVAAIFGSGKQARTQLEAVCVVRDIRRALVFGRDPENTSRFIESMSRSLQIDCVAAIDPAQLKTADIVCAATSSETPVFDRWNVADGCHINGVGSYRRDMAELPGALVRDARVVVDHLPACLAEAGDLLGAFSDLDALTSHVHAELGEIVSGKKEGRTSEDQITLFKSVGNAVQDLVAAAFVLDEALRVGAGTPIEI